MDNLTVHRDKQAQDCPDQAALALLVQTTRAEQPSGSRQAYLVTFSRERAGYVAEISLLSARARRRRLRDQGPTCDELGHATAVTLALLLDVDREAHASDPIVKDAAAVPGQWHEPAPARKTPPNIFLEAGAGALLGVLSPIAPIFNLNAGLQLRQWRFMLGGEHVPKQSLALAPGRIITQLWTGELKACWSTVLSPTWSGDACAGLRAGVIAAEGRDYPVTRSARRPWAALLTGMALRARPPGSPWAFVARPSLLLPWATEAFTIDGVGSAYRPRKVAAEASVGVQFLFN